MCRPLAKRIGCAVRPGGRQIVSLFNEHMELAFARCSRSLWTTGAMALGVGSHVFEGQEYVALIVVLVIARIDLNTHISLAS